MRVVAGEVTFYTRNGHDWTNRLPELAAEAASLAFAGRSAAGTWASRLGALSDSALVDLEVAVRQEIATRGVTPALESAS